MKKTILILACLLAALMAGAQEFNNTLSPDGKWEAFTDAHHDLYVRELASGATLRLTDDGSELILNGYASWVYYEEIFGRQSNYRAFWWSPDSRKLAFYRFDNSQVAMFPIYSACGKYGSLSQTRYPKAGDTNPGCRIGIISLDEPQTTVWADFDYSQDQYFGTPFWGDDSQRLFVQRMPRVQQQLELFAVSAQDGSLSSIYTEEYHTWTKWMEDMLFGPEGLVMVRDFETGWQQLYFLSYDGSIFKRLTDGPNWRVKLLGMDSARGDIYFTAYRDSDVRCTLYRLDRSGAVQPLTNPNFSVSNVEFSDDWSKFKADLSTCNTPPVRYSFKTGKAKGHIEKKAAPQEEERPQWEIIRLTLGDGTSLPAKIAFPKDFDPEKQYPLVMEIYGGPDTPYVYDSWRRGPSQRDFWYYNNGVIKVVADSRAAGHNGRADIDLIYRDLVSVPVEDFCAWGRYFQSLPYVDAERIGVEGFSFGGTMTAMLVFTHPEIFRCGIAGGGVYDWELYDTHYTERFMDTPQRNPEGYSKARVLNYVESYDDTRSCLKLTHGTGDDNVHFQNTLQLIDALQQAGKQFELMIYPDGMHGYRGAQGLHDMAADAAFWTKHLKLNN